MSATLTWAHSGFGTKTGTTNATLIDDIVTLAASVSGGSTFSWQVASSQNTNPFYVVLKRKDASAGRILLVIWGSAPAGNNAAILDVAPTTNALYGAYFPAGNVDTPSNLTASSGTILGNDTGAVKVWGGMAVGTIYAANLQPYYRDSQEAMLFGFQNPAASASFLAGAGALLVDQADNAYDAVFSNGATAAAFGSTTPTIAWTSATTNAGTATACVRTNYGATNRVYFTAWAPSGLWANVAIGAADIMSNTSISAVYFVPIQLLGQAKGEGFVLKLRQIAMGPGTVGPFTGYNTTGPVEAARQLNGATAGVNGYAWATNFKL